MDVWRCNTGAAGRLKGAMPVLLTGMHAPGSALTKTGHRKLRACTPIYFFLPLALSLARLRRGERPAFTARQPPPFLGCPQRPRALALDFVLCWRCEF